MDSLLMRFPFRGPKSSFRDWWNLTWKQRWPAIWGAFAWSIGTVGYNLAAPSLGFAIAFILAQSSPFVSSLFSLFYWKELKHAGKKTWVLEISMLLLFATSVCSTCLALSLSVCSEDSLVHGSESLYKSIRATLWRDRFPRITSLISP